MLSRPLENPEPLDYQATIVLVVAALGLSAKKLLGFDLESVVMSPAAFGGEPWRLFTSVLLHGDWLHLLFNVYWTLRFGPTLEPLLGTPWTLVLYLVLGVSTVAAQWAITGPAIGLSGIGFGMFGMLWVLDRHDPRYRGVMARETAQLFGLWFVFCLVAGYAGWMNVANGAHSAGFVVGVLCGWAVSGGARRRVAGFGALALVLAGIGLGATGLRPLVNRSDYRASELFDASYQALLREDHDQAVALLLQVVEIAPDATAAWNNLAIAYRRLGLEEEADAARRRWRALDAERAARQAEDDGGGLSRLFSSFRDRGG